MQNPLLEERDMEGVEKKKKAKSLLFELDQMSCLEMEFSLSMFGAL